MEVEDNQPQACQSIKHRLQLAVELFSVRISQTRNHFKTCGFYLVTAKKFACFELHPKDTQAVNKNRLQNCHKMGGRETSIIDVSTVQVLRRLHPDHLLLDRSPTFGPLVYRWELDKFKTCCNKSFTNSKILTLLYQQFSNSLISQRDMSGPRLGALSNNR